MTFPRIGLCLLLVFASGPLSATQPAALRTADGVLEFAANAADGMIEVTDRLNGTVLSRSLACSGPRPGVFTPDEVSLLVLCDRSNEILFLNTAAFDVTGRIRLSAAPGSVAVTGDGRHAEVRAAGGRRLALISLETAQQVDRVAPPRPRPTPARPNEVVFLGMIHGEHRTSTRFSLEVLRRVVRAIRPDYWLTEMPPNRLARATEEFARTGTIAEPRVSRFPEYVDVLFPLARELPFTVFGTAAWSQPMDKYRRERLAAIARRPDRAADWRAYQDAEAASERALAAGGAADDPRWIHTDAYDAAQRVGLDVYNARFDAELGTGGWDTINRAHFAHIARVLDAHRGEGARILITYGAGHKSWMLPRLRDRDDLTVLDVGRFLDAAGVPK